MPEAQTDHPGEHERRYRRGAGKLGNRGHLCINPPGLAGLEFHFFPTLLPLTGHKPVLLGQASRSCDHKILATLFFSPLLHSSNFYRERDL